MQARTSTDPTEDRIFDEASMDRLDEVRQPCPLECVCSILSDSYSPDPPRAGRRFSPVNTLAAPGNTRAQTVRPMQRPPPNHAAACTGGCPPQAAKLPSPLERSAPPWVTRRDEPSALTRCAPSWSAGVRKHCRKSHPEWLREVDLEKAANGCRWAAYCTREAISEGNDPRMTAVGSKRAREIMAAGGMLPPLVGGAKSNAEKAQEPGSQASKDAASGSSGLPSTEELLAEGDAALLKHTASRMISGGAINVNFAAAAERRQVSISVRKTEPSYMSIGTAMDGKSALRPPAERRKPVSAEGASRESMLPPEMVSVPTDLSAPLPTNTSSLTPNAQARQRLGEIADGESSLLLGHGSVCPTSLPSPLCDGVPAPPPGFGFFVQWSMPPLKRGRSLADTRDAEKGVGCSAPSDAIDSHPDDPQQVHYDSPSFLDSVLN